MADTAITTEQVGSDVSYRASQMPVCKTGTVVGNDTDYHAVVVDMRGKGRFSYCIDNKTNKTVTVTLYGAHSATATVGGDGVFAIDSTGFTVAATSTGYETSNEPFPFVIVRLKFADTPDGNDVVLYTNAMAF